MKLKPKYSIAEHFNDIEDIRIERGKKHKLIDIITISICAVVCGADGWIDIEMYGIARKKWLEKFLELPNGIPSHDTFARVFSQINPDEFNKSFLNWIKGISKITAGEIIAFDGKQSRNSGDEKNGKGVINTSGESLNMSSFNSSEMNRGREEIRNYLMITDVMDRIDSLQKWKKLASIGMVESVRVVDGKTSVETRYFISSLENNAEKLAAAIRGHWSIENSLHWVLDVAFQEDNSRIRKDNAPANFAVLRHIAVNIISQNKSRKLSVRSKRFLATLDEEYSTELLEAIL